MSDEGDSGEDIFITQNTFSEALISESDINPEFEELLNDNVSNITFDISNSNVVQNTLESVGNSSSDEDLLLESQKIECNQINSQSDDELMLASQQIEKEIDETAAKRFGKPLSETDYQKLENLSKNKNTEKKSQWAVRIFDSWQRERRDGRESELLGTALLRLSNEDLNRQLSLFVTEVRNQRGGEYTGNSIHEILISMQRFMRQNGRNVNFTSDFAFVGLRNILDAKMKSLAQSGIGMHRRRADVITRQEEDMFWEKGLLGDDSPEKLLDTVFYLNGINFCLRGGEEHRALKVGANSNFSVVTKNSKEYLIYSEGVSKTNSGGLKHKRLTPKVVTVASNEQNPARCPVRIHQKYMSLRPGGCDDFYLRPLKYPKPGLWYSVAPVGRHILSGVVKKLCARVGLEGFYTNHSLRATTATRLYESGLDEQLIAERTGHRSTAIRALAS